jgi:hypothetical protein
MMTWSDAADIAEELLDDASVLRRQASILRATAGIEGRKLAEAMGLAEARLQRRAEFWIARYASRRALLPA